MNIFDNDFSYNISITCGDDYSEELFEKMIQFRYCLENNINSTFIIQDDGENFASTGGSLFMIKNNIFIITIKNYGGESNNISTSIENNFSVKLNSNVLIAFTNFINILENLKDGAKLDTYVKNLKFEYK